MCTCRSAQAPARPRYAAAACAHPAHLGWRRARSPPDLARTSSRAGAASVVRQGRWERDAPQPVASQSQLFMDYLARSRGGRGAPRMPTCSNEAEEALVPRSVRLRPSEGARRRTRRSPALLESSWAFPGTSWSPLAALLGCLNASPGALSGRLGALLGRSWGPRGLLWGKSGVSNAVLDFPKPATGVC